MQAQQLTILSQNFPFISQFFDSCDDLAGIDSSDWLATFGAIVKPVLVANTFTEAFAALGALQLAGLAPTAGITPVLQTEQHYAR